MLSVEMRSFRALAKAPAPARVRLCAAVTAATALMLPGLAVAAIVVASSGPSAGAYPVGKKLDDAGRVVLKAGDTLTVLDAKGTRVLRGAGTFPVAAAAATPAKSSTFAALTMQRSAQRVRTGAVRAGKDSAPPASPNIWFIDVAKGGTRCIVAGQPVRFWRLDTSAQATFAATMGSGPAVPVSFPAGAMIAPWDAAKYPLADGSRLTLAQAGKPAVSFAFAVLANAPGTPEGLAEALIARGCVHQLDLLTSTLARP